MLFLLLTVALLQRWTFTLMSRCGILSRSKKRKCASFSIEGNIGAGKSTVLSMLPNKYYKIFEPVHLYTNFKTFNPLALFVQHPAECAAITQLHIMECCKSFYSEKLAQSKFGQTVVSERSLFSCKAFVKAQMRDGSLHCFPGEFLLDKIDQMMKESVFKPDVIILLVSSPETCKKRIKQRARSEDEDLSLNYLSILEEEIVKSCMAFPKTIKVEISDGMRKCDVANAVQHIIENLEHTL